VRPDRILPSILLALSLAASGLAEAEETCPEGAQREERREEGLREAWCARPDGVLHGVYRSWHANGQLRSETHYRNGVEHGLLRAWHPNGAKALEARFADSELDGPWREWHANGQRSVAIRFEAGKPAGSAVWWYVSGAKRLEGAFEGFANEGVWTTWWESGARKRECTWRGGVLEGPCRGWDEAGAERFAVRYVAPPRARRFSYWRSNGDLAAYEIQSAWEPLMGASLPANAADE
jgi:antitoxin component YwqK of YwqJK toxin-antitoxin module